MLELIILLIVGFVLAVLFLLWGTNLRGQHPESLPAPVGELLQLVPLLGVSYQHVDRLFEATDYKFLTGLRLLDAAQQLDRDRRHAALLWLALLRDDFIKLQQFHRILMACGTRTNARAEWALLMNSFSFRLHHSLLVLWIHAFGLYAVPEAHTEVLASLRRVSTALATLLARLSPDQLAEVKDVWAAQHPQATSAG